MQVCAKVMKVGEDDQDVVLGNHRQAVRQAIGRVRKGDESHLVELH